jgi:hypothetical protein
VFNQKLNLLAFGHATCKSVIHRAELIKAEGGDLFVAEGFGQKASNVGGDGHTFSPTAEVAKVYTEEAQKVK